MKKGLLYLAACASIGLFVTTGTSYAEDIIRITTTNYYTKIEATLNIHRDGEDTTDNTSTAEMDGNIDDEVISGQIAIRKEAMAYFTDKEVKDLAFDEGISAYYYDVHDEINEITAGNKDELCALVPSGEDCEEGMVLINTILDKHQTYTIILNYTDEVENITVDAPEAGDSVNLVEDEECEEDNCDVPDNTPNASIEDGNLDTTFWGSVGMDEFEQLYPDYFTGTFEAGEEYTAIFFTRDNPAGFTVNGEEPEDVLEYRDEDGNLLGYIIIAKLRATGNPDSGDAISAYMLLFGISFIGVIGSAISLKKAKE